MHDSPTHFLNADLEFHGRRKGTALAAALGKSCVVLQITETLVSVELLSQPRDLDAAIAGFCEVLESWPKAARTAWFACDRRVLNIGIQGGARPHAAEFSASLGSITSLASMKSDLTLTVYSP